MKNIKVNELHTGNWISNSSGIYEVVKVYEAAGGIFITVKEVHFDDDDKKFSFGEEYDMTAADVKHCELVA